MFFRREKPKALTFDDRLENLRQLGFSVSADSAGGRRVSKYGCAAVLKQGGESSVEVGKAGIVAGTEIATLVNGGYQQFFITPSGKRYPALAQQLKALHDFQEDLRDGLGIISLYNTSLGTISDRHVYDRVKGRPNPLPETVVSSH
jgi:hypothetical protein